MYWSVRQWAHVFAFLIIGMCISLFDQSVRIFIVWRHFDFFDLVLEALGYVSAIVIVSICRGIYRLVVNRK